MGRYPARSGVTPGRRVPPAGPVVLALLVAVGGCSDLPGFPDRPGRPAPSEGLVPGAPRGAGFSLVPPPGFVPVDTEADPAVTAAYALPGDGALRPTISVVVAPTSGDLASEVAGGRRLQPTVFLDYRSTTDEATTLPGGERGWLSGGAYTLNGAAVRNIQLTVVERGFAYTVTGVSPAERFADVEPAFRSSFTTFSVD